MTRDLAFDLPTDVQEIERFVQTLLDHGRGMGFNSDRLRLNLRVGVTEALTNAMLYGNSRDPAKRVGIRVTLARHEISVRVTDEGHGFDPSSVPDPTTPANIRRARGRGIFLIRQLMDHVEYNATGNSVEMRLKNGPPGPIARAS